MSTPQASTLLVMARTWTALANQKERLAEYQVEADAGRIALHIECHPLPAVVVDLPDAAPQGHLQADL
jgi:hypothetical protein